MTDTTAGEGVVRGPITHEVKCWTVPFAAVKSGAKPWELRKNDRDYRVGDTLIQHEWEPDECRFTGDSVEHVIGWALYGPAFGLPEGYVVMSLAAQPSAHPVDIVPSHCTGASLSFEPGVLHVSKDGSGYIAIDEGDFSLEDDRCEGPDGPEGSVHWITRLDASEIVALRDFLNGSTAQPDTGDVAALREATGGRAVVRDGQIVISIDVDALPMIVSGSCATYSLRGLWKVTDAEAFAKDVCMSLNAESENGTTRVHTMFDGAFDHAIEQGAEGVDAITEDEFEVEASRLRLAALSKPNAPGAHEDGGA
jgi:hypothetical protein